MLNRLRDELQTVVSYMTMKNIFLKEKRKKGKFQLMMYLKDFELWLYATSTFSQLYLTANIIYPLNTGSSILLANFKDRNFLIY